MATQKEAIKALTGYGLVKGDNGWYVPKRDTGTRWEALADGAFACFSPVSGGYLQEPFEIKRELQVDGNVVPMGPIARGSWGTYEGTTFVGETQVFVWEWPATEVYERYRAAASAAFQEELSARKTAETVA